MAAAQIRAGVVGCGFQGKLHLEHLSRLDGVDVVAACDRDGERLRAAKTEFGVPRGYLTHIEMLQRERLDLLTICTMPDSHAEVALDAFAAGAGVLCEKPMAPDLESAVAMADAARRSGSHFSVGFNLRYSTAAEAVRKFAADGRLGDPVCARGSMLETEVPWWGPHQVSGVSGGGAIASTGVHMIDLLMWLAGNPRPVTATASAASLFPGKRGSTVPEGFARHRYDVEDLAFGHVRFESGFWLTIEAGWTWDAPGSECRFDLVGERAQASAEPLRFSAERSGELIDVTEDAVGDLDFPTSVEREIAAVVDAVRSGEGSEATIQQALEVQAVVDALYRSLAEGREVEVENVRRPRVAGSAPLAAATGARR